MAESIKKVREPRDHQRGMTWEDQHGRRWNGLFEMESAKGPDGRSVIAWIQLSPANFVSPIDIPADVVEQVFDDTGEQVFGKVKVNYPKWKAQNAEGRRGWVDRLQLIGKKMYPNNYGEAIRNPTTDLLIEVGPAPMPLEFIEAAEVGNKWALGITKQRPSWVTDDLLATRDALKRSTGWRESGVPVGPVDASKYPDAEDEQLAALRVELGADDELVGVGATEPVDYEPAPKAKPPKRRNR